MRVRQLLFLPLFETFPGRGFSDGSKGPDALFLLTLHPITEFSNDMAWFCLFLAGLFEIGWPLGFKLADLNPRFHGLFLLLAVASMGLSGWLLYLAQKTIPMGTAYMIWTGIGGVGTVVLGIVFFHDAATLWRMFFLLLILVGIVGLKLVH